MRRLPWSTFGTSIFTQMTQAAIRFNAVNLAQGFPNFDGPSVIKEAAAAAIHSNKWNQYAPSVGIASLRQRAADRLHSLSQQTSGPNQDVVLSTIHYDFEDEVTVFSGATEALFCSFLAFLKPGDECITFAPFFDCYPAGTFASGAKLVEVPLTPGTWEIPWSLLESLVTSKTKMLLLNTPHNPTGKVFSVNELHQLSLLAEKHDLIVVTDEVYDELYYGPSRPVRFASLPNMHARTVTLTSMAKTYSLTGWKVGFAFAPSRLTKELRAVHQFTVFCSATPLQAGFLAAFDLQSDYYETFRSDYKERRDLLCEGLQELGFEFRTPDGAYFVCADFSKISQKTDTAFAFWLAEHIGVAVIPVSSFYLDSSSSIEHQKFVRFAFCKDLSTIQEGLTRLRKIKEISDI
jgi:aspartate/methionine/tyrosine aminotransferase